MNPKFTIGDRVRFIGFQEYVITGYRFQPGIDVEPFYYLNDKWAYGCSESDLTHVPPTMEELAKRLEEAGFAPHSEDDPDTYSWSPCDGTVIYCEHNLFNVNGFAARNRFVIPCKSPADAVDLALAIQKAVKG